MSSFLNRVNLGITSILGLVCLDFGGNRQCRIKMLMNGMRIVMKLIQPIVSVVWSIILQGLICQQLLCFVDWEHMEMRRKSRTRIEHKKARRSTRTVENY